MSNNQPNAKGYEPTNVITEEAAMQQGMSSLTTGYGITQYWMLGNTVNDMRRGRIEYALVASKDGIQVWRKNMAKLTEARSKQILSTAQQFATC